MLHDYYQLSRRYSQELANANRARVRAGPVPCCVRHENTDRKLYLFCHIALGVRRGHEVNFQVLDKKLQSANLTLLCFVNDVAGQYGPQ
jgi:hypothetical protein